jgi:serine protease Do
LLRALINTRAELIGINSQILSPSGGNIGIGFAVPSNMAHAVMTQLVKGGKVRRGRLGISIQPVTSDIATNLGLKEVRGVLVNAVTPGSPADRAGLKTGDVIVALNGQSTNNPNELRNRIASAAPGTQVTLRVFRDGTEREVKTTLSELTPEVADRPNGAVPDSSTSGRLGMSVQPLTPDDAAQLGLPRSMQGVVVREVDDAGPAANAGIEAGDVILQANRLPVRSPDDLRVAAAKSGSQPMLLLVYRSGQSIFVTVRPRT